MEAGFIGLGAMGYPMALNLHKAKLLTGVYNRTRAQAEKFAQQTSCRATERIADLAQHCDAVVICVTADADVLEVVDALAAHLPKGALVIDCSTVSAGTAREAAQRLAARRIDFLDCPVSGGTEGAAQGTLTIMCGGQAAAFERAQPVLRTLGQRIVYMGPAGAGQATKAVNQIAGAGIAEACTEAMAFAEAEGLDLAKVIEVLTSGASGSWFLAHRGASMITERFPLGFKVSLHDKDLAIAQQMAAAHGVQLPVVEMTRVHYRRLIQAGHGNEDISALYRLKRALFGH
ncbi:MAG: NAD(P)-dependent oxidoreductase [Gammaproteobacteria bacterium]